MTVSPHSTPTGSVTGADQNLRLASLAMFVLLGIGVINTWVSLEEIERSDHWFRNADMNVHNMVDALSINADVAPNMIDQPGVPLKYLLALNYRLEHERGNLPVWNLERFAASPEPLHEIRPLIRAERSFSRMVVIGFIIAGGFLGYQLSGSVFIGGLIALLLCGSSGLVFHGFITRPELMCVFWGGILALFCTDRGLKSSPRWTSPGWMALGGLSVGFSYLSKLPGICFLALAVSWVVVRSFGSKDLPKDGSSWGRRGAASLIFFAVAGAALWLAAHLRVNFESIGQLPMVRLRQLAMVLAGFGCVVWWQPVNLVGRRVLAGVTAVALLVAGLVAVFPVCYGVFRLVMSEASASDYLARTMLLVFNPVPFLHTVATNANWAGAFELFFRENRGLYGAALVVGLATVARSQISGRERGQIAVLVCVGFGLTLIMSKRHYLHQYNLFSQSMLLLAMGLSFHGWYRTCFSAWSSRKLRLVLLMAVAGSYLFGLGGASRAFDWYRRYQDDALPNNPLTVLFLFSHDAHTKGYLDAMRDRYGDRDQFAQELQRYLADPDNRY